MHRISDIYFVGGFGTVQWVDVAEYAATIPDSIVLDNPHKTLQVDLPSHAIHYLYWLSSAQNPTSMAL